MWSDLGAHQEDVHQVGFTLHADTAHAPLIVLSFPPNVLSATRSAHAYLYHTNSLILFVSQALALDVSLSQSCWLWSWWAIQGCTVPDRHLPGSLMSMSGRPVSILSLPLSMDLTRFSEVFVKLASKEGLLWLEWRVFRTSGKPVAQLHYGGCQQTLMVTVLHVVSVRPLTWSVSLVCCDHV